MWVIILTLLLTLYLLFETVVPRFGSFGSYVIRPLLWISLAIITYIIAFKQERNILIFKRIRHWYLGKSPLHAGFLLGGFQVSILIIVGMFTTFGKSPYATDPSSLLINVFFIISMIFGIELSRSYLVNTLTTKKRFTSVFLLITLLYVFIQISPDKLSLFTFSQPEASLQFIGETFITAIAINLLATYLSYLGGATSAMAYTGLLLGFEWFSPILPTPHWTIIALIGTITPTIGFLILQDSLLTKKERRKIRKKQRYANTDHFDWTIVAITSLLIIFFSFGYLGVTPTVIYSGSMTPTYEVGDIVLIDKVDPKTVQEGDVIQFLDYDNSSKIIHRIIKIEKIDDKTYYYTKGDANDAADFKPITRQRILGKPIGDIPKLGWLQILVKSSFKSFDTLI